MIIPEKQTGWRRKDDFLVTVNFEIQNKLPV
jgi:hypothetical protein